jgi:hypothetical protein
LKLANDHAGAKALQAAALYRLGQQCAEAGEYA